MIVQTPFDDVHLQLWVQLLQHLIQFSRSASTAMTPDRPSKRNKKVDYLACRECLTFPLSPPQRGGREGESGVNKVYCGLCGNGEFKRDKLQIEILVKVARPSIFVCTLSIFESLILKKKLIFIVKRL